LIATSLIRKPGPPSKDNQRQFEHIRSNMVNVNTIPIFLKHRSRCCLNIVAYQTNHIWHFALPDTLISLFFVCASLCSLLFSSLDFQCVQILAAATTALKPGPAREPTLWHCACEPLVAWDASLDCSICANEDRYPTKITWPSRATFKHRREFTTQSLPRFLSYHVLLAHSTDHIAETVFPLCDL
jgi:hypothetical protein